MNYPDLLLAYGIGLLSLARAELLPQTELVTNCFNFPRDEFDKSNSVKNTYGSSPHLLLETGLSAIDFTLHDINGVSWNLGEKLQESNGKPVALIWGMSTCPAYQGLGSAGSSDRWSYWDEYALVESHGDKAIFVHVYGPEPHPSAPDNNFDSGRLLPNFWSLDRQALTYDERVEAAQKIRGSTHPDQVILPDYLPGNPYSPLNQPVWCSYANGARSAVLVSSSGKVFYQQGWLNTDDLGDAIDAYWAQDGQGALRRANLESGSLSPLSKPSGKAAKDGDGKEREKRKQGASSP